MWLWNQLETTQAVTAQQAGPGWQARFVTHAINYNFTFLASLTWCGSEVPTFFFFKPSHKQGSQ